MQQVHIGRKGIYVTFPAGYMNRATRRRMAKMRKYGMPAVIAKSIEDSEK